MLNSVRTAISRRTGATTFIAGWWIGANMKPTPVPAMQRATCSGCSSIAAPSASMASALPALDDTLRLPCLATRAAGDQRCRGGDVEGVRTVAAGADDVDQVAAVGDLHRARELTHHPGGGGDLVHRLLLHPQPGEDRGGHHRRDLAAHDLAHQVDHLVVEDLAVLDGALQGFLGSDGHGRAGSMVVVRGGARAVSAPGSS